MSKSGYIEELEKVLLNQIEMLNEEGILEDPEEELKKTYPDNTVFLYYT